MYYVEKRLEISASHKLKLGYESKCENLHGHNWIITVCCMAEELNEDGMIVDFDVIKKTIMKKMDHKNLNEEFTFNTTAENLARWVVENIPNCYSAEVQESEDNKATYELYG